MYPPAPESEHRYTPEAAPASGFPNTATLPKPSVPYYPVNSSSRGVVTPRGIAGGQPWSTSLCHCCDDPANCVITCCCPCITFGQIAEIVDKGNSRTRRCSGCAARGTMYGLLVMTGFACLYSCFYRSKLRGQYDLEESPCVDCLVHFCCEVCALCQEYRELKNRGFDMGIANMERQQRAAGYMVPPDVAHGMTR